MMMHVSSKLTLQPRTLPSSSHYRHSYRLGRVLGRGMSMVPQKQESIASTSKVIDVASSYINTIRLKIATSLTSSMTESDRQQLLSSFNINYSNNNTSTVPSNTNQQQQQQAAERTLSIGEAVADAVAKEAAKRTSIFEQEKIQIMKQAEKAAIERVQNDLLIKERKVALAKWEKELEEEKRLDEQQKQKQKQQMVVVKQESEKEEVEDHHLLHPILGKVLIDFGYKRVHVMSAKKLAAIPIWEKQRVYRHDRAKVMARDKMKSLDIGLPGVVALHEVSTNYLIQC